VVSLCDEELLHRDVDVLEEGVAHECVRADLDEGIAKLDPLQRVAVGNGVACDDLD
jgi:hypothetical protein